MQRFLVYYTFEKIFCQCAKSAVFGQRQALVAFKQLSRKQSGFLQNINIPAYLFFAFQIVQQRLPYYFISVGQQIGALSTVRPRVPSEISSKKILPQHATFPLFSRLYQQQGQTAAHRPNIRCTAVMSNAARRLIRRSVRRISRKNVEFRRFYRKRIICCCKRSPHTV